MDAARRDKVADDGRRCADLWQEESGKLPALPPWPFEARQVVLVPVSSKSTVRIEGVIYSVPSGWARLEATH